MTIDGSCLGPTLTGTQVLALELAGALARRGDVRLRVTVPRSLGDRARAALDELGVERMWHDEVDEGIEPTDIVHRPYQVTTPQDLLILGRLGRRVVLTQLDSIAYHNPAYFADYDAVARLPRADPPGARVRAPRRVLLAPRARRRAGRGPRRRRARRARAARHRPPRGRRRGRAGRAAPGVEGRPFLLCLGTDFLHKNHPFAFALFERLRSAARLRGPARARRARTRCAGRSEAEEAAWRAAHPELAADVVALGECPEAEKAWLYRNAALVLYPTTFEGFGFIPFEAAQAGTPSLWAAQSSMADLLPAEHAGIVPWDADASAANAARLIARPGGARGAGGRGARGGSRAHLGPPRRAAAGRSTATPRPRPRRVSAEPRESLTDLAMSLVGPGGWLDARRPARAAGGRPRPLRRAVFGALRGGYRAMYRVRRARG